MLKADYIYMEPRRKVWSKQFEGETGKKKKYGGTGEKGVRIKLFINLEDRTE